MNHLAFCFGSQFFLLQNHDAGSCRAERSCWLFARVQHLEVTVTCWFLGRMRRSEMKRQKSGKKNKHHLESKNKLPKINYTQLKLFIGFLFNNTITDLKRGANLTDFLVIFVGKAWHTPSNHSLKIHSFFFSFYSPPNVQILRCLLCWFLVNLHPEIFPKWPSSRFFVRTGTHFRHHGLIYIYIIYMLLICKPCHQYESQPFV